MRPLKTGSVSLFEARIRAVDAARFDSLQGRGNRTRSPVIQQLAGAKVGDTFEVVLPSKSSAHGAGRARATIINSARQVGLRLETRMPSPTSILVRVAGRNPAK